MCHSTLEVDSTNSCRKKIMWVQLNQIKPLGFDSPSNTSSWRLFFKSSVSYPCFWSQNSFSTYQQINCSLRILKTLHLVHVRRSSVALQCYDALRINASFLRSSDHLHRQSYFNHIRLKNQKHSSAWLSATQQWNGCSKMQILRQSSKYCNPSVFHCQDLISNILYCLFKAINVSQCRVRLGLSILGKS